MRIFKTFRLPNARHVNVSSENLKKKKKTLKSIGIIFRNAKYRNCRGKNHWRVCMEERDIF